MLVLALSSLLPQGAQTRPTAPVEVALTARAPDSAGGLRWSPKGAKVVLKSEGEKLVGAFELGPKGSPKIAVALEHGASADRYDVLCIDIDRDGRFGAAERFSTVPTETRGKWWSSFSAVLQISGVGQGATVRPYPMNLWYVFDPQEPRAEPALRWSRSGWHEGECEIDGKKASVLITEMEMDGVFDQRDSWALGRDHKALVMAPSRSLETHAWLDGKAYRAVRIDPAGTSLSFEAFDPGISEAQERAKEDVLAPDRQAPRAKEPLHFTTDFAAALLLAEQEKKRVLVDFQTTWCGPCKVMDDLVYKAAAVVDAAKEVLAVKLDGDVERELVKRFQVSGYPTMLLLDSDGKELRRAVGYRSVAAMVEFLSKR